MVFTAVNGIEFTFRKYRNMKMAIRLITTHFVVEGHNLDTVDRGSRGERGGGGGGWGGWGGGGGGWMDAVERIQGRRKF